MTSSMTDSIIKFPVKIYKFRRKTVAQQMKWNVVKPDDLHWFVVKLACQSCEWPNCSFCDSPKECYSHGISHLTSIISYLMTAHADASSRSSVC